MGAEAILPDPTNRNDVKICVKHNPEFVCFPFKTTLGDFVKAITFEKSNSFWILGETYLLQAKLALISLNLEEARRLLTKGQRIVEKYELNHLAIKISNEHDEVSYEYRLSLTLSATVGIVEKISGSGLQLVQDPSLQSKNLTSLEIRIDKMNLFFPE